MAALPSASESPRTLWFKSAFATFSFCSMNITLNIFNSWALRKDHWPDFEYPIFYTMCHMVVTALAALLLLTYVNPAPRHAFLASSGTTRLDWCPLRCARH